MEQVNREYVRWPGNLPDFPTRDNGKLHLKFWEASRGFLAGLYRAAEKDGDMSGVFVFRSNDGFLEIWRRSSYNPSGFFTDAYAWFALFFALAFLVPGMTALGFAVRATFYSSSVTVHGNQPALWLVGLCFVAFGLCPVGAFVAEIREKARDRRRGYSYGLDSALHRAAEDVALFCERAVYMRNGEYWQNQEPKIRRIPYDTIGSVATGSDGNSLVVQNRWGDTVLSLPFAAARDHTQQSMLAMVREKIADGRTRLLLALKTELEAQQ